MKPKQSGRRRFLKDGAALAGLAVGAVRSASGHAPGSATSEPPSGGPQAYGVPSPFATSARGPLPALQTPLQDLKGIITPNGLHYTVGTGKYEAGGIPLIDPREHRLLIHGMVDHPLIFTMEELMSFPSVSRVHFLECSGNGGGGSKDTIGRTGTAAKSGTARETHGKTSCSEWTGVLLSVLLKEVGVQKGAGYLVAEGADAVKHTRTIPLEKAMYDSLLAYSQNGEPVRPEQGYPLRLLAPGWEGNINVKWLRRIKVVDEPYMAYSEITHYASSRPDGKLRWYQFQMPPKSVITFPSGGQRLTRHGFYEITGLAWSGGGAVRRVEVSTDGGRSWKDASLQEPIHRIAHTRFRLPWHWNGEEAVLQSRCTDELGQAQPTLAELCKIWGVDKDYWQSTTNYVNHFNPIHSWRITSDGSVYNALFD
jgi:sulfane dehydrogenase subunit SoxC